LAYSRKGTDSVKAGGGFSVGEKSLGERWRSYKGAELAEINGPVEQSTY
jgi:hypothetical protein